MYTPTAENQNGGDKCLEITSSEKKGTNKSKRGIANQEGRDRPVTGRRYHLAAGNIKAAGGGKKRQRCIRRGGGRERNAAPSSLR